MADPVTIIGTASALLSIIEVIGKTVGALHDLREKWKEAEFTFVNLIAQLTALRVALTKIQEWANCAGDEVHHQLVMDLDVSTTCCRMPIDKLDSEVSQLGQEGGIQINTKSKLKFAAKTRDLEGLQKMVERQTNALTLLLTACTCKTVADQKTLLEKTASRKTLSIVREDTSSLYVHRSSTSLYSRCTDNLSKLSVVFQFDRELFISKVYEKALRGSLKETVTLQRRIKPKRDEATQQSQKIDSMLRKDDRRRLHQVRILLIGSPKSGKNEIVRTMRLAYGDLAEGKRSDFRIQILAVVRQITQHILDIAMEVLPSEALKLATSPVMETSIPPTTAESVVALWVKVEVANQSTLRCREFRLPEAIVLYAVRNLPRIASNDYQPNADDIDMFINLNDVESGAIEHKVTIGPLDLVITDPGMLDLSMRRFGYFEGHIKMVMFAIDTCCYENEKETLAPYRSVAESGLFTDCLIIFFLTNLDNFSKQLQTSPLDNYYPDYAGGHNTIEAAYYLFDIYIRPYFSKHTKIYCYPAEASDISNSNFVPETIKYALIQESLAILLV